MKTVEVYNMSHIYISSDMIEAIRKITSVNFRVTQCLESRKAKKVYIALNDFVHVRNLYEYNKFMRFYGLYSLSDDLEYFKSIVRQFCDAVDADKGICVEASI
jgi:hypothetical protein